MIENMSMESVMNILQNIKRVEKQAVDETGEAKDAIPPAEMKTRAQFREEVKNQFTAIDFKLPENKNLLKTKVQNRFRAQKKSMSKSETKIIRAVGKAKSKVQHTEDNEVIVKLLHDKNPRFMELVTHMSKANTDLKLFLEQSRIDMGYSEGDHESAQKTVSNLESKFTTNARSRSVGGPSRAARPRQTRTDARPGWMNNLGM